MFDSSLWTGLVEKIKPQEKTISLRSESVYVAVNYSRKPIYISPKGYYLARDARIDIAEIYAPTSQWRSGWKRAKKNGWRIRRGFVQLEPGQ